jgi:PhnB protein
MTTRAKSIPARYQSIMPFLSVRSSAEAIAFYTKVFGAEEELRLTAPDGSLAHAEVRIGDVVIAMADENPAWGNPSPETLGGTPVRLSVYVDDVDAVVDAAVKEGATLVNPVSDHFYGERSGRIMDPFGHVWIVGTFFEDMTAEEMQRRFEVWIREQV